MPATSAGAIALTGTSFTLNAWIRVESQDEQHRNFLRRGNHANYELAISGEATRFGALAKKGRLPLLADDQVADSLGVLHDYGNMSSPTILFVLKRFLGAHEAAREAGGDGFANGVAMAFGPGLTLEGALFRRVGA